MDAVLAVTCAGAQTFGRRQCHASVTPTSVLVSTAALPVIACGCWWWSERERACTGPRISALRRRVSIIAFCLASRYGKHAVVH